MAVVISMTLAGCISSGNPSIEKETESSVSSKIIPGTTTKPDIKSLFGSQAYTDFTDSGKEIWSYDVSDMNWDVVNYIPVLNFIGSSSSGIKKQLVVMFNGDKVMRFSMAESPIESRTGLFK